MINKPTFRSICVSLMAVAGFAASTVSSQATVSASATISGTAVAGGFDYTITLDNTGTSSLQSFWYGWIQFQNDLPSNPSNAANSLGWINTLDANSIQWGNNTDTPLAPGNTGTFTFFSTSTPTAITTTPSGSAISGQSVAYTGSIDFSQGPPPASTTATPIFSPVLVASPEPSSIALLGLGSLGFLAAGWRKLRAQQ
jgi:hypothetical protein